MGKYIDLPSTRVRRVQAGVFIVATVALMILLAALALLGAHHWAIVDWQTALKNMPQ